MSEITWIDAAYKVLKEKNEPMHISDLTSEAKKIKESFEGKTPENTISALIGIEIRNKPDTNRFIRLGKGHYSLKEWVSDDDDEEPEPEVDEPEEKEEMKVLDKKVKALLDFETLEEYSEMMLYLQKTVESKQRRVTVEPANCSKWTGIAIFGDLHFWDPYIDSKMLNNHTEKVLSADNVMAIQVGDILSNQASITTRKSNREAPFELSLAVARKAARIWFKKIGPKMAAFIIGNHDERSLRSEGLDIGEIMVEEIKGAYLGTKGDLIIPFHRRDPTDPTDEDLVYTIRIVHGQKEGYSMWNPLHPGARVIGKRPYIDFVAFGHRHASSAYNNIPLYDDVRVVSVRSAGYNRDEQILDDEGIPAGHYAWKVGEGEAKPGTPIVLLHPERKEYVIFTDLDLGLKTLKLYNKYNVR